GNDQLAGGAGEDELHGLQGDDTYLYRAGDGHDRIEDNGGGFDRLVIEGYDAADARLVRMYHGSDGVVLSFVGSDGDSLTLVNMLADGEDALEEIEFADGTVWDRAMVDTIL